MLHQMFVVYDSKAHIYTTPFCMINSATAMRGFSDAVKDINHPYSKHPGDYSLINIGTYDDEKCEFLNLDDPKINLGLALDFVNFGDNYEKS